MKTGFLLLSAILVAAFTLPFRSTKTQAAAVTDAMKQTPSFTSLHTQRQEKGVAIAWKTTLNDRVLDFIIQRTYEDPAETRAYWENIATITCSPGQTFAYTDKEVFPGTVYYRVTALLVDGRTVQSKLSSIQITDGQEQ